LEKPDQYRATTMIATTMNAAISERARLKLAPTIVFLRQRR
jgi:hypothetical protein